MAVSDVAALVEALGPRKVVAALVRAGVLYKHGSFRVGGAELDGEYAPLYSARHEVEAAQKRIRRNR